MVFPDVLDRLDAQVCSVYPDVLDLLDALVCSVSQDGLYVRVFDSFDSDVADAVVRLFSPILKMEF